MLSSLICSSRGQDAAFESLKAEPDVDSLKKGLRIAHDIGSAKEARVNTGHQVRQVHSGGPYLPTRHGPQPADEGADNLMIKVLTTC